MLLLRNNKIIYTSFLLILFSAQPLPSMAEINFDHVVTEAEKSKGNAAPKVTIESNTVEKAWEKHLEIQESERADSEEREERRKDYEDSHPACKGSKNSCYDLTPTKSPYRYKVECTNGSYTGKKTEVCGKSNGKWASGCGITDSFAHHYRSAEAAAINACGL